jgi:hypothetical protein
VNTIMRYLLEELSAYEEGYSDMLMPNRQTHCHDTFMGKNATRCTQAEDPSELDVNHLAQKVAEVINLHKYQDQPHPGNIDQSHQCISLTTKVEAVDHLPVMTDSLAVNAATRNDLPYIQEELHHAENASTSTGLNIFDGELAPCRIPTTKSFRDALHFWETGDSSHGLDLPLKDWPLHFTPGQYRDQAVKYNQIKHVVAEFYEHHNGDMDKFARAFPSCQKSYSQLVKDVRQARIDRGETKNRTRG